MNYLDIQRGVDFIESRWGPAKQWVSWEKLQSDFAPFSAGAFMEALHGLYKSGLKYPPSSSEVLKHCREVSARRVKAGVDEPVEVSCDSGHQWALPFPTDVVQEKECVRCGEGAR